MAEKQLKALRYQRGTIKSRLTNAKKFIESVENNPDFHKNNYIFHELEERCSKLATTFNEFNNIQSEIENLEDFDDECLTERLSFEETHFTICSKLKSLISKFNINSNPNNNNPSSPAQTSFSRQQGVTLPTLSLPKFAGNFENWVEFRDSFNDMIHLCSNLSDIQKFHYLNSLLQGTAAQVIKSLRISEANYAIAWEMICKRFDNKKSLITSHIKSVLHMPTIKKPTASSLRELIDNACKNLRALENLNVIIENSDPFIIQILVEKLDEETSDKWDEFAADDELFTFKKFKKFIELRADILDKKQTRSGTSFKPKLNNSHSLSPRSFVSNASNLSCIICKNSHKITDCDEFSNLDASKRFEKAKSLRLCINCLNPGHQTNACKSKFSCKTCNLKHHTLLHFSRGESSQFSVAPSTTLTCISANILLSTAIVEIFSNIDNKYLECRVLLDSGSQLNFVTSDLSRKLGLELKDTSISVTGISQVSSSINSSCNISFKSKFCNFSETLSFYVIPKICDYMPSSQVNFSNLNIPTNITLADPYFNEPGGVDLLIGADYFWNLTSVGQIKLGNNLPVLQKTLLGWILSGRTSGPHTSNSFSGVANIDDVQVALSKFWELEENVHPSDLWTPEETQCEVNFTSTTKRDEVGRFIVTIPLKDESPKLGDSKFLAFKRFKALQNKFKSNNKFKELYCNFMDEYESLGHMSKLSSHAKCLYFLPHHGVFKTDSITTKLRIVFDGSAPTSTGASLNNLQCVGPSIQSDLFSILVRFRQHKFVISADVAKMYRQVLIAEHQRPLQCILWSPEDTPEPNAYMLNTVTYGTASASFLAIRCLKQLADENSSSNPRASEIINSDFYVDDLLTGTDDLDEAIILCSQISDILKQGNFDLRKWISNDRRILDSISQNDSSITNLLIGMNDNCKTLGISWSSLADKLFYTISPQKLSRTITKRSILSTVAQIFDPLGLLGSCTIIPKIIMQKLWLEKLSWDESVPMSIHTEWMNFLTQLNHLNEISIPRRVVCDNPRRVELHGFSDSSEKAYGACIYLRSLSSNENTQIHLVAAKSKVAPLKFQTLPRLELCGAVVLAKLLNSVTSSLRLSPDEVFLWTDSTIVLGWIRTPTHLLKTFVKRRVSQILNKTKAEEWQHVKSKDNPADLISRGVSPEALKTCSMWWNGPEWLSSSTDWSMEPYKLNNELPELKIETHSLAAISIPNLINFESFSNFLRLQRTMAYVLRFISNSRLPLKDREFGNLSLEMLNKALNHIIKLVQITSFNAEMTCLTNKKLLGHKSKIQTLNPFIDPDGLIRVGGRLRNSDMPYDKKHPIILPSEHNFTKLLLQWEHKKSCHSGPQQLLYLVRERFWPLSGRNLARKVVHECIICYKTKPIKFNPPMGNLPLERLTPSFPFNITGIDYAGPFLIKNKKGRGARLSKCYVALFICFTTKAIHIEIVSDLTTELFIASLRRFISRRGKPLEIHSDNATNFVGANNKLTLIHEFLVKNSNEFANYAINEGIQWKFIPPRSPNFGGLWEAGVKSLKTHLKKVMGTASLTFEEFYTLLVQIEAVLNSRPLSPLSSDPTDLNPLTPAHFLIGRPLISIAEPDTSHLPENRLNRYEYIERLRQHFWKRWYLEFTSELQQRPSTRLLHQQPEVGGLVLISEENQPPMCWRLGRIHALHPGTDNHVRVVSVYTTKGIIKRALSKLCPLPSAV